jgi:GNAT superfamily N-acetyltransferase
MATVQVRDGTLDDASVLGDIFRRASLSNEGDRDILLANPDALELSDTAVREGRTRVAVAVDESIAGFASTRMLDETIDLEDLFVDPTWMRRGIGRELVLDALTIAGRCGARQITVIANRHALRFYESLGFVCHGEAATRFGAGLRMTLDVPGAAPS